MKNHNAVRHRVAVGAAAVGGTTAAASAAGSLAAAAYFARRVLTPDHRRPDDTHILKVSETQIVMRANPEIIVDGHYGLWLDAGAGHLRVGEIISVDSDQVTRRVDGLDAGVPQPGTARWNAYYWSNSPEVSLGLPTRHIDLEGELGSLPAWVVPAAGSTHKWAILIHGRGARREETLRAMPVLHSQGFTILSPTYRNDEGVDSGPDGRYNLGLSEWRDVESAVQFALDAGAREIVLGGWSMGGAIALQFMSQSVMAGAVTRVLLDGPVIDWNDVLRHHGRLNHLPQPIATLSRTMMGRRWGKRLVGVHDVVDVAQTDWVARADELKVPILIIHSLDDEFVPARPSSTLAQARPDLVTFVPFAQARHCKEWNRDRQLWEDSVTEFLRS